MDASQNDLETIRRMLLDLTARVYRIEQRLRRIRRFTMIVKYVCLLVGRG